MWKHVAGTVLSAWLVVGCDVAKQGDGSTVTESRQTGSFRSVRHEGSLDIIVREGTVASVQVTLDENLQERVRTFVGPDAALMVVTDGHIIPGGPARVEITVPRLVGATLEGSGQMTVEGFIGQADEDVRLVSSGSGSLRYCGSARTLEAKLEGSGRIKVCTPPSSRVETVDLSLSGSGELSWSGSASRVRTASEGSGQVTLTGETQHLGARLEGSGGLEARELRTVDLDLVSEGSGHATAWVDGGVVNVALESSGNVDLWGSASQRAIRVNGGGRVVWH